MTRAFRFGKIAGMTSALISYRSRAGKSQKDLAAQIGVRPSALCKWERGRIPAERVIEVERITGIPRHELRPDLYPPIVSEGEAA